MKLNYIFLVLVFFLSCHNKENQKAEWITGAFETITSGNYPRLKAVAWWNENFDHSYLKINSSEESLEAYRQGVSNDIFLTNPIFENNKLIASDTGIYHSAFPDFGGTEDEVSAEKINEFEDLAGKKIVWAYFSNNWTDGIEFPIEAVKIIHSAGKVPFIRMMPRSNFDEGGPDSVYTMQKIIDGEFDEELTNWAKDAADVGFPLLVEFGTEVNGNWFPWNGEYNGGSKTTAYGDPQYPDGPERFRDAYRHIIDICMQNGADNITWFFHVDANGEPDEQWNSLSNYYPGDDYIDWLGISVYGPQEKKEDYASFEDIFSDAYNQLSQISTNKPIAVLEFGITEL